MSELAHPSGLGSRPLASRWGWFVALGAVMILGGIVALGDTVLVTLLSVIFIGAALVVSGAFQIIHAFANKAWSAFLFGLLSGVLYVAGGFLIMREPVQGSVFITILLVAVLAVGGALRIGVALRHREMRGWWLLLLGGAISIVLAGILFATLPWSGLWVLGTLIGIELLIQGISWTSFGFALRARR